MCNKIPLHIYVTKEENLPWATTCYKEVPRWVSRQIIITTQEKASNILENLSLLETEYPNTLYNLRRKKQWTK